MLINEGRDSVAESFAVGAPTLPIDGGRRGGDPAALAARYLAVFGRSTRGYGSLARGNCWYEVM
ncbi:MAG: hypothetical protein JWR37_5011 [Mycobacterium sp.]|nr:hypothetical protein [Mycobacterium sp.]